MFMKIGGKLDMVEHASNYSTQEAEAGDYQKLKTSMV